MGKFNLQGITVVDTQLTSSTGNNITQCGTDLSTAGGLLKILFRIIYPIDCTSTTCKQTFIDQTKSTITQTNDELTLSLTSTNGTATNVTGNFCSITSTGSGTCISLN